MKKSINILLFLFAVCTFSPNRVIAQSTVLPIAGTEVGLEHDPSDIIIAHTTTDQNGKFSFKLPVGKSKITLLYDQIKRAVSSIDKNNASNKDAYVFILSLNDNSYTLLDRPDELRKQKPFVVTKELNKATIQFNAPKGGETISCTLTYTKVK